MSLINSTVTTGASNTPTATIPSGVVPGTIVILGVTVDDLAAVFDPGDWPSGFTELDEQDLNNSDGQSMAIAWKRATAAESGTYTFAGAIALPSPNWVVHAIALGGRHPLNNPTFGVTVNNVASASPASTSAPTLTALEGDDLLHIAASDGAINTGNGHAPPTNYTELQDTINFGNFCNLATSLRQNVSAGATGAVAGQFTLASGTATVVAWHIRVPKDVLVPKIKSRPFPFASGSPNILPMGR